MEESLPTMVDDRVKDFKKAQAPVYVINDAISKHIPLQDDLSIWLALKYKFERLHVATTPCRPSPVHPRDQDDPHDDAHPKGENSAKRQKIDPKAPALSLVYQDLLYLKKGNSCHLKKGNSGPEKVMLSLHKFLAAIFLDDDIEKITSRWNPHAKIFYIKKQKDPEKPKEVVYSNLKIVQIIKTYWELGHEHKFITEIIARRANGSIVSITKSEYKNLNKNDIKDMYMLFVNNNVDDYARLDLLCHCQSPIRKHSKKWEKRVEETSIALGWHLEEIHVTWAHLKKKRRRLRLYTKSFEETVHTEREDGVTITKRRLWDFHIDGVTDLATVSERNRLKVDLESSMWRQRQGFNTTLSRRFSYIYKTDFRVLVV
ncbi:hypothetical protein Tco_0875136 [Tanacetum coccineum]|uniref:Uncharacterized protein n=1 Tax=Tanacetum coccineum TaxID=301880 RepID=A0ABQ5BNS6_9ASTR